MNEYIEELLRELIEKVLKYQPELITGTMAASIKKYRDKFRREFVSVPENVLRESIAAFNNGELYRDKPFIYFIKIVENKQKDYAGAKEKDKKRLGCIPKNIM